VSHLLQVFSQHLLVKLALQTHVIKKHHLKWCTYSTTYLNLKASNHIQGLSIISQLPQFKGFLRLYEPWLHLDCSYTLTLKIFGPFGSTLFWSIFSTRYLLPTCSYSKKLLLEMFRHLNVHTVEISIYIFKRLALKFECQTIFKVKEHYCIQYVITFLIAE